MKHHGHVVFKRPVPAGTAQKGNIMTVQNQNVKNVYRGNGSTTVFPFTFAINEDHPEYLHVYITNDGGKAVETTDFTYDMEARTVTYPKPSSTAAKLSATQRLTIYRVLPYTQGLNLVNQGPFFSEDVEKSLDDLEMQIQQLNEEKGRSLRVGLDVEDFDTTIPLQPGKTFRVNDAGTGFELTEDPAVAHAAAEAAKDAAEEAQEKAEQARDATVAMATEEVEMFFNPHDENTALNECNIIKIKDKVIMIDTGAYTLPAATQAYLEEIGVTKVDYLFLSHYHGDHAGGLPYMTYLDWSDCVAYIPPLPSYETSSPNIGTYYNRAVAFLQENAKQIIYPAEGDRLTVEDVVSFTMYNCDSQAFDEVHKIQVDGSAEEIRYNDYSMVVVMQHRNITAVYSGDIERFAQQRILDHHFYQNIQLYKMHHHSQEHYGNMQYCASLNPQIVTVQVGNSDATTMLGQRLISTDLQYFIDKIILIPHKFYAKIVSTGSVLRIEQGTEMYKDKDLNFFSLSPNHNRLIEGQDLNTLFEGTFTISSSAVMNTLLNAPENWTNGNARLICIYNTESGYGQTGLTGYVLQIMLGCNNPGIIFTRTFRNSNGWSDWKRLLVGDVGGNIELNGIIINQKGEMFFPGIGCIYIGANNQSLRISGGNSVLESGSIILNTKNEVSYPGIASLSANDSVKRTEFIVFPDGHAQIYNYNSPIKGAASGDFGYIDIVDANGSPTARISSYISSRGTRLALRTYKNEANSTDNAGFYLEFNSAGETAAYCPTPPDDTNNTRIATTKWVTNKINSFGFEAVDSKGSNFIRYKSGMQICWGEDTGITSGAKTVTFPVAFTSTPEVIPSIKTPNLGHSIVLPKIASITASDFKFAVDNGTAWVAEKIAYIAIGTWI